MTATDERHLILQVQEGSHDAYRVLVERYMKHAYNVAYGYVNDHDDAEDIAQEAFVRVYQSIGSFRGESEFGTWLYRIVANLSLNRMRKAKTTVRRTDPHADPPSEAAGGGVEGDIHRQEIRSLVERAVHELPTLQRAVVILRHLNGLSTKQVSNILRCSEGTVKTHLHRGMKKMRAKIGYLANEHP